jgi:nanoRNase/pAp phosphatase (c-di-AMP/oligoRNAs hydrolase)
MANTVFAIDRSILDRSSRIDIGQLCLSYSVGGHEAAGTCQVDNERAETNKSELIARLAA